MTSNLSRDASSLHIMSPNHTLINYAINLRIHLYESNTKIHKNPFFIFSRYFPYPTHPQLLLQQYTKKQFFVKENSRLQ